MLKPICFLPTSRTPPIFQEYFVKDNKNMCTRNALVGGELAWRVSVALGSISLLFFLCVMFFLFNDVFLFSLFAFISSVLIDRIIDFVSCYSSIFVEV